MKAKRLLKIYGKHSIKKGRKIEIHPEIRLSGKWLKDIGFEHGNSISVVTSKNKITIKRL